MDRRNITLDIPAGVQSGEQIIIPDKGYKDGQGGRGNLIAQINTIVPKQLTDKEKELFFRITKIYQISIQEDKNWRFNINKGNIEKMKKIILHLHLDGSLERPETVRE